MVFVINIMKDDGHEGYNYVGMSKSVVSGVWRSLPYVKKTRSEDPQYSGGITAWEDNER